MSQALNTRIDHDLLSGTHAFQEHLRENEKELLPHNIVVRVESIHQAHRTAMCSVRQRDAGLLRRRRSAIELIWRAEQALAPLLTLGISPMVQVRRTHRLLPAAFGSDPRAWLGRMAQRLGYPASLVVGADASEEDPFGWRRAMASAFGTKEAGTPS